MRVIGWRGVFWVFAAASAIVAAALWWRVPGQRVAQNGSQSASPASDLNENAGTGTGDLDVKDNTGDISNLGNTGDISNPGKLSNVSNIGYRGIVTSRIFLSYLPLAMFGSGGFAAIQSLWAGPWLIEVAGHSRAATAEVLLVYGFALLIGYLIMGFAGSRIAASPTAPRRCYIGSLAVAFSALAVIISNTWPASSIPWFVYGLTLGAAMLAYPALTKAFPAAIAGRVVTAYNFAMFVGAFALQWSMGALIQALIDSGTPKLSAYQVSFGSVLVLQVAALVWFWGMSRRTRVV